MAAFLRVAKRVTGMAALLQLCSLAVIGGTKIMGSNGTEAEFAALFDAKPSGLVALLNPDSSAITIPWSKIDLAALKQSQPQVYQAYEKAVAMDKDQPLGMGLAEGMLSLGQLSDALKQAVKDPNNWPYYTYYYGVTYTTTTTESGGRRVTRTYYPAGYVSSGGPFVILKRIRDAKDDKVKRELLWSFKNGGYGSYGVNTMLERIESTLGRIPPERMFPREPQQLRMIKESAKFKTVIEDLLSAEAVTAEHQSTIKSYFALIGIE